MSSTQLLRRPSRSARSGSRTTRTSAYTATHNSIAMPFRPCAATAAFFLYAQDNLIVSLHHDTLAIDRHFDKHREDVLLISVDNTSEINGGGALVASYDASQTAIIWDVLTGEEIARFTAYEHIQVAAWTRNGNVAFGNSQGNIILFEPNTAEHTSARTIVDPVTALAPLSDSKTYAIGYLNGSILIAMLQPTFTIIHTLPATRLPSPITGLAWHGSSSKQKSDMLATQTSGGDLRIWSISRDSHAEPPRVIRVLKGTENVENGRSWFAWSKNGRIIQHLEEETRIWDVRTKDVTHNNVSDVREVAGIANYGPGATLFTIAYDSTVQQYDVAPQRRPTIVANAQRIPPNAPPTPPDSLESRKTFHFDTSSPTGVRPTDFVAHITDSSEDELAMSPLQKIAREIEFRNEEFDDEQRDLVGPMSPASSKVSGTSSASYGHRNRARRDDRTARPFGIGKQSSIGTVFSPASFMHDDQDGGSVRSSSSTSSSQYRTSSLRHEMLRSPDEPKNMRAMDLFPFARRRQREMQFRLPRYDHSGTTTDSLRQEMLSIVFGWEGDVEALIRDEYSHHKSGSASGVLLSKWLGELGADSLAQMVGSESMTSSDWMLLALSCSMGQGSQKAVGEAFVKRLLESDEVHPAVAILLGLGEQDQAIAVYASRKFYFEAVVLTCLLFPNAWQRQVTLLRDWGEAAALDGQPEFAARCFACTAYQAHESQLPTDPFVSNHPTYRHSTLSSAIPFSLGSRRVTAKNASLKLITNFHNARYTTAPATADGVTPILESALSPSKDSSWQRLTAQSVREPSSARTVTPGTSRGRYTRSATDTPRGRERDPTPLRIGSSQTPQRSTPEITLDTFNRTACVSPAPKQSSTLDQELRVRNSSNVRGRVKPEGHNEIMLENVGQYKSATPSASRGRQRRVSNGSDRFDRTKYNKGRSRGRSESSYSQSGRKSPTSPIPMTSSVTAGQALSAQRMYDDERFYGFVLPRPFDQTTDSFQHLTSETPVEHTLSTTRVLQPPWQESLKEAQDLGVEAGDQHNRRGRDERGRDVSLPRAPSPLGQKKVMFPPTTPENSRLHSPLRSDSYFVDSQIQLESAMLASEPKSKPASAIITSQHRKLQDAYNQILLGRVGVNINHAESRAKSEVSNQPDFSPRVLSRKEHAARELEERRLSLARRPSVPIIPRPGELGSRPTMGSRSVTEAHVSPSVRQGLSSFFPSPLGIRSHTVDPEAMMRLGSRTMTPLATTTTLGLPANPAAMLHQKKMPSNAQPLDVSNQVSAAASFAPLSSQHPRAESRNNHPALLPSTVFTLKTPPARSASAPPEKLIMNGSPAFEHRRRESTEHRTFGVGTYRLPPVPPLPIGVEIISSDGEDEDGEEVIVVNVSELEPTTILAELQHLATPAPPPPPPPPLLPPPHSSPSMYSTPSRSRNSAALSAGSVGMINIAMERVPSPQQRKDSPLAQARPTLTGSPSMRRRSSVTDTASTIGNKWRNVTERIRSSSKNRAKSPPIAEGQFVSSSPYETVLSSYPFSKDLPGSPPQGPHIMQGTSAMSPLMEQAIAPKSRLRSNSKAVIEYHDPKDLRANVQDDQFVTGGMI